MNLAPAAISTLNTPLSAHCACRALTQSLHTKIWAKLGHARRNRCSSTAETGGFERVDWGRLIGQAGRGSGAGGRASQIWLKAIRSRRDHLANSFSINQPNNTRCSVKKDENNDSHN
jgi:hypothetical protein